VQKGKTCGALEEAGGGENCPDAQLKQQRIYAKGTDNGTNGVESGTGTYPSQIENQHPSVQTPPTKMAMKGNQSKNHKPTGHHHRRVQWVKEKTPKKPRAKGQDPKFEKRVWSWQVSKRDKSTQKKGMSDSKATSKNRGGVKVSVG